MSLALDDSLEVAPDVMFRQLNEEAVLLDLKNGTYFGLNDTGARMWQLIQRHACLARVIDVLVEEYATPRTTLERDLLVLCNELCDRGLLTRSH